MSTLFEARSWLATTFGDGGPPFGEVALVIVCAAFLLVIIEVTVIRRPAALDRNLRIPLDDGMRVDRTSEKGGSSDEPR